MRDIHVTRTYGAIFDMDQMCDATIPDDLRVGDLVALVTPDGDMVELRVATIDIHRSPQRELDGTFGIGLRGKHADQVRVGDVLQVREPVDDTDRADPLECNPTTDE